jgi:hypothetical protein
MKLIKVLAVILIIFILFITLNMVSLNIKVDSEQNGIRSTLFQI